MVPASAARLVDDRTSPSRAALHAAFERRKPDALRSPCEKRLAERPRRWFGFRVRILFLKAIACDQRAPTSDRPASGPSPPRANADTNAREPQLPLRAAERPDWRRARPPEYHRR